MDPITTIQLTYKLLTTIQDKREALQELKVDRGELTSKVNSISKVLSAAEEYYEHWKSTPGAVDALQDLKDSLAECDEEVAGIIKQNRFLLFLRAERNRTVLKDWGLRLANNLQVVQAALGFMHFKRQEDMAKMVEVQNGLRSLRLDPLRHMQSESAGFWKQFHGVRREAEGKVRSLVQQAAEYCRSGSSSAAAGRAGGGVAGFGHGGGGGGAAGKGDDDDAPPLLQEEIEGMVEALQQEVSELRLRKEDHEVEHVKLLVALLQREDTEIAELRRRQLADADVIMRTFRCPITNKVMRDPVVLVGSGHSYERRAIERVLSRSDSEPITGEVLSKQGKQLVINRALKDTIDRWLQQEPNRAALNKDKEDAEARTQAALTPSKVERYATVGAAAATAAYNAAGDCLDDDDDDDYGQQSRRIAWKEPAVTKLAPGTGPAGCGPIRTSVSSASAFMQVGAAVTAAGGSSSSELQTPLGSCALDSGLTCSQDRPLVSPLLRMQSSAESPGTPSQAHAAARSQQSFRFLHSDSDSSVMNTAGSGASTTTGIGSPVGPWPAAGTASRQGSKPQLLSTPPLSPPPMAAAMVAVTAATSAPPRKTAAGTPAVLPANPQQGQQVLYTRLPAACWLLASCGNSGAIRLWNSESQELVGTLTEGEGRQNRSVPIMTATSIPAASATTASAACVVWQQAASKGAELATATTDDGTIHIWDTTSLQPLSPRRQAVQLLHGHSGPVTCLSWHPHSEYHLASGGTDGGVRVWDTRYGSHATTLLGEHAAGVTAIAWRPQAAGFSRHLASCCHSGHICLWDMSSSTVDTLPPLETHGGLDPNVATMQAAECQFPLMSIAWSPDGALLASGDCKGFIYVWDVASHRCATTIIASSSAIMGLAWRPNVVTADPSGGGGATSQQMWQLTSCGDDVRVRVWDLAAVAAGATHGSHNIRAIYILIHEVNVRGACWRPDGRSLACIGTDGAVHVWDVSARGVQRRLPSLQDRTQAITGLQWRPTRVVM